MSDRTFTFLDDHKPDQFLPVIKIIGVGGCGSNVASYLVNQNIENVTVICVNTDKQALDAAPAEHKLQLGEKCSRGLGAGGKPEQGRKAAEESSDAIREMLKGTDLLFITAGMGGGTGTGAAPVVAAIAREMDILTLAFVTKPFDFEGKKKYQRADEGWHALLKEVDALITVPNQKILDIGKNIPMKTAMNNANNILYEGIKTLCETLGKNAQMNMDFADVRSALGNQGVCMIGVGIGKGENRAVDAALTAISSPLLEQIDLSTARSVLVHLRAPEDIRGEEIAAAFDEVNNRINDSYCDVTQGMGIDPNIDYVQIMVLATGMLANDQGGEKEVAQEEGSGEIYSFGSEMLDARLKQPIASAQKEESSPYLSEKELQSDIIPAIIRQKKIDS